MPTRREIPADAFNARASWLERARYRFWNWSEREPWSMRVLKWLVDEHTRVGASLFCGMACVGAGYLWTDAFGDGIRGGITGPAALDNASTLPDANVAGIAAMGCLVFGGLFGIVTLSLLRSARKVSVRFLLGGYAAFALVGLALFGVSRLFV